MFKKEDYYYFLDGIKFHTERYLEQHTEYDIHPLDIIFYKCFSDFILLTLSDMNKVKDAFSKMIDSIYLENKEFFDDRNKNLSLANKNVVPPSEKIH
jgi:hypothetical protein